MLVGQAGDQAAQLGNLPTAQPGGGLVEQQHRRVAGGRPGDGAQSAPAVWQLAHLAGQLVLKLEQPDHVQGASRQL